MCLSNFSFLNPIFKVHFGLYFEMHVHLGLFIHTSTHLSDIEYQYQSNLYTALLLNHVTVSFLKTALMYTADNKIFCTIKTIKLDP